MNYSWTYASINDANDIMGLNLLVQHEINSIFNFNPNVLAHQLSLALVNQFYTGKTDLVALARDSNNKLLAYTWAKSGNHSMWSTEEIINVTMAHVDPNLSPRSRILLLKDQLTIWERFAQITNTPLISSNTLRLEQNAFLKLHKAAGYIVRGSFAYKKVDLTTKPAALFA
jgi:hypothetical protein